MKHYKYCFVPAALGAAWLAKDHLEDEPIVAAYFALTFILFVYGFFNWDYLGNHIVKMNKSDLMTTLFIAGGLMVGTTGIMIHYEIEYPILNALILAFSFVADLLLAKGVHDGWLLMSALSVVMLLAAILTASWLSVVTSLLLGLSALYVFVEWSLDYYGSIRFRIID